MARTGFIDDFRRNFLTGFAALFPILITVFLLSWLYRQTYATVGRRVNTVCREVLARQPAMFKTVFRGATPEDSATMEARRAYAQAHFPRFIGVLIGLIGIAIGVYLIGRSLRGYIGKRLMRFVDRFFERFPVIKAVYPYARQVGDLIFGQTERRSFSRVVAIEYPRRGTYAIGFLTGEEGQKLVAEAPAGVLTVFIPTSPTPLTGFVVLVPPEEVMQVDMTVDEAFRFFVTAGMLTATRQRLDRGRSHEKEP